MASRHSDPPASARELSSQGEAGGCRSSCEYSCHSSRAFWELLVPSVRLVLALAQNRSRRPLTYRDQRKCRRQFQFVLLLVFRGRSRRTTELENIRLFSRGMPAPTLPIMQTMPSVIASIEAKT